MSIEISMRKETKNVPGSFVIEFAGTPFFQRFDKITDPIGDSFSAIFDVRFKGFNHHLISVASQFNTSDDVLGLARQAITNINTVHNNGHNSILTGGIFEELAYINFYEERGILSPQEVRGYRDILLSNSDKTDFVICLLFLTFPF